MATAAPAGPPGSYPSAPRATGMQQAGPASGPVSAATPAVAAPVATASGRRATGLKRLGRKGLIGIIAGALVLALGIGGGVWLGRRQPTVDPDNIGYIFSPSIQRVMNDTNPEFTDSSGEGQFSGDELRAGIQHLRGYTCVDRLKGPASHVEKGQALRGPHVTAGTRLPLQDDYKVDGWPGYAVAFDGIDIVRSTMKIDKFRDSCLRELANRDGDAAGPVDVTQESGRDSDAMWVSLVASLRNSGSNDSSKVDVLFGCLVQYGNVAVGVYSSLEDLVERSVVPKASQIDCKSFAQKVADRIDQLT
ncbi:hypothetical protein [Acidipropionibacterium acidipropionici]|uniref:hypothetical protein n=1 Tax=Acidipropionibacterium acidipropionici TaxID=1748 RepID=UPI00110BFB08|nr:hypothetical protein [Acidipropionibacterium acidipropionici]QCV96491.1 hypothetical protein FEZ30_15650 [Acidipropionibacterium acidipropionici]